MASLEDVAASAGVSKSTASRVLSTTGYAGKETRARVLQAAIDVGYVPNRFARSLRTRRSHLIGLLIGDVENAFYSSIASTMESAVVAEGYHVLLCSSGDDPEQERQNLSLLYAAGVGAIAITPTGQNRAELTALIDKGISVVQIDRRVHGLHADAVVFDNKRAAAQGVTHLIDAGHRRIGILTGRTGVSTASLRLAGYRQALTQHGITVQPDYIRATSFRREHAVETASELLLTTEPRPTAVFATNNVLAEATLVAARSAGMRIPEDLSLVAFGDYQWMTLVTPPITALRGPLPELTRHAARLLMRRQGGHDQSAPRTYTHSMELIPRESVRNLRDQGQ